MSTEAETSWQDNETPAAQTSVLALKWKIRALELGLTILVGAFYALLLTGDYFVGWSPLRGRALGAILVFFIAAGVITRLSLSFQLVTMLRQQIHLIVLGLILVLGLAVRVYPLDFGLPTPSPAEEASIAGAAWRVLTTGDYNLHSFSLPGPYVYVQAGAFALSFLAGVSGGIYARLEMASVADFYTWARLITAVFGVATVYLVYLIGVRLYKRSIGLLSSFLLAFSFLHAQYSNAISPDVPAAFLVTVAVLCLSVVLCSTPIAGSRRVALFGAAGVAIGLAAAVRYSMIVGILVLAVAYFLTGRSDGRRRLDLILGLAGVVAGFLAGAPFVLLDLPGFSSGLAGLAQAHGFRGVLGLPPNAPLAEMGTYLLGVDFGVLLAALVGAAIASVRHRRNDLLVLSFPVLFFVLASSYQGDFAHVLVPVMPFGAILAARAIDWLFGRGARLSQRLARLVGRGTAAIPWIAAGALVGVSLVK